MMTAPQHAPHTATHSQTMASPDPTARRTKLHASSSHAVDTTAGGFLDDDQSSAEKIPLLSSEDGSVARGMTNRTSTLEQSSSPKSHTTTHFSSQLPDGAACAAATAAAIKTSVIVNIFPFSPTTARMGVLAVLQTAGNQGLYAFFKVCK